MNIESLRDTGCSAQSAANDIGITRSKLFRVVGPRHFHGVEPRNTESAAALRHRMLTMPAADAVDELLEIVDALRPKHARGISDAFPGISGVKARFLELLVEKSPNPVDRESVMRCIYFDKLDWPDQPILTVMIYRIRKILKKHNVPVTIPRGYGDFRLIRDNPEYKFPWEI